MDPVLLSGANELHFRVGISGQKTQVRSHTKLLIVFFVCFSRQEISNGVCIRWEVGAGRHDGLNLHSLAKQEYLSKDC